MEEINREEINREARNYISGDPSIGQQPSDTIATNCIATNKPIHRRNSMVAGVAGGLSEYLKTDPTPIRLLIVGATFAFGPVVPAMYAAAWIIMPNGETKVAKPTPPPPSASSFKPASSIVASPPVGTLTPIPDDVGQELAV